MSVRGILSSFAADPSVVSRIFLYMPANGMYVDAVRALPVQDALYTLEDSGLMPENRELWQNMLTGSYRSQWLCTPNRKGSPVLYYIQTIPSVFEADSCNVIVAISTTYLSEVFDTSMLSDGEWIGMLSEMGEVVYSPLSDTPDIDLAQAVGDSGHFVQNGRLITWSRSSLTRNLYFSMIPLSTISHFLHTSRSVAYVVLLAAFFICTVITYLTTVKNFKPIAYLNTLAKPDEDDPDVDEFTRLRISLMEASDEKRMRMDRARYAQETLEDQRLIRVMLAANNQSALEKRLQREELKKVGNAWVLLSVSVIDFSDDAQDAQTALQQAMTQVHDSLSTLVAQFYTVLPLYGDKTLLALVNLPSNELQHLAYLNTALTNLLHLLRSSFSIDCQIAVSAIHPCPALTGEVLSAMLTQTQVAADSPTEGESILFYATRPVDKVMQISVEHTMHRLMHASLRGAAGEATQLIEHLTEQVQALTQYQAKSESAAETDEEDTTEMRIKRSILEVVKNEYPDPMLNVSAIADRLGKNVDYISRVFKQTTTIGLLDYIHHMRVKAAKELLINQPALSVMQISQRVGYFGVDSFIRSFKRIEGITPGRYRAQSKGE
jgi:AraC-like DNA-binding protein